MFAYRRYVNPQLNYWTGWNLIWTCKRNSIWWEFRLIETGIPSIYIFHTNFIRLCLLVCKPVISVMVHCVHVFKLKWSCSDDFNHYSLANEMKCYICSVFSHRGIALPQTERQSNRTCLFQTDTLPCTYSSVRTLSVGLNLRKLTRH